MTSNSNLEEPVVVQARDLVKHYGSTIAVDGVSFEVHRGETFGLLGPNGAGKTTVMRMLTCASPFTSGSASVAGLDVSTETRRVRQVLGVVTQSDGLDPDLTVRENLVTYGFFFGFGRREAKERAETALGFFDLVDRGDDDVGSLSGGMKRRLCVARAFVTSPAVVVLDEPTTGLDPQARIQVWEQLEAMKATGVSVLMSTHYMDEAAQLCDRLIIMHHGRVLAEGTPDDLTNRYAGREVAEVRVEERLRVFTARKLREQGYSVRAVGAVLSVTGEDGNRPDFSWIGDARVTYRAADLEDVFLALAGRGLREES